MRVAYNLIDEPWIPGMGRDGATRDNSLLETLTSAHEITTIEGSTPQETAALLRLLLAILHRVYPTAREEQWGEAWDAGRFDRQRLEAYFGKWHERFDLFHLERPFYQSTADLVEPKPLLTLRPGMRSAGLYFHDAERGELRYRPAQAARMLVNAHAFGTPGIVHPQKGLFFSNAPWLAGLVIFLEGESLFHTLMLNLLQYAPNHPHANLCQTPEDAPAWEMEEAFQPERSYPFGYLDYLTWQNRRVHLLPVEEEGEIWVREVIETPGLKLAGEVPDPMKHYREDEKVGRKLVWFNPAKALWRHSASLLAIKSKAYHPPKCIDWAAQLADYFDLPPSLLLRMMAVGVQVESKSKVVMHRLERFPVPVAFLEQEGLAGHLDTALAEAGKVRGQVYYAVITLAKTMQAMNHDLPEGRKPDEKDPGALAEHWGWEGRYWPALELPFYNLMEELPARGEDALDAWRETLTRTAWQTLEDVIRMAGDGTAALKAAVKARAILGGGLNKLGLRVSEGKKETQ
jgi:CRISPR system Cascade subunit CasA